MWQRTKHTHGTVNEGRSHVDAKTEALVFNLLFNQQPVLHAVRDFSQECKTDSSRFSHGIRIFPRYRDERDIVPIAALSVLPAYGA